MWRDNKIDFFNVVDIAIVTVTVDVVVVGRHLWYLHCILFRFLSIPVALSLLLPAGSL